MAGAITEELPASTSHQVVIDAETRLVAVVGRPLPGNRNDCKAWEDSGANAAVGTTSQSRTAAIPARGSSCPTAGARGKTFRTGRNHTTSSTSRPAPASSTSLVRRFTQAGLPRPRPSHHTPPEHLRAVNRLSDRSDPRHRAQVACSWLKIRTDSGPGEADNRPPFAVSARVVRSSSAAIGGVCARVGPSCLTFHLSGRERRGRRAGV